MTPLQEILDKLPSARKCGAGWSARCPAHDDRKASLSLSEGDGGKVVMKCHAGCKIEAVCAALGLAISDLFPDRDWPASGRNGKAKPSSRRSKPKDDDAVFATDDEAIAEWDRRMRSKHSAKWPYWSADGELVGWVIRWDRQDGTKDIRPASQHPNGWKLIAMPAPLPLYNLAEVITAKLVIVCEGEKAADAARGIGFVATTSASGSDAAAKTDWRPVAGKEVWILPDNDGPGQKYADTVAGILATLSPASVVKVVNLPNLPDKGDIVDWIDAHGDAAEGDGMRAEIQALATEVEPRPGEADSHQHKRFQPFPVHQLPEPVRSFVDAGAKATNCDTSYLALPMLVALAAAIGNTRRLELKRGWSAPPILWGAIVGESGTAKTPAFKLVRRPVDERQRKAFVRHAEAERQYQTELARWKKSNQAWERDKNKSDDPPEKPAYPPCERFVVNDTTVEALAPILAENRRGLLLARDELAGWLGSFDRYAGQGKGGADSANFLSMFNAESITIDRKTGMPRTIHVPQAAVCVVGGIQPGILRRNLGPEHRESGLAARMLLTNPPRKAKRWTDADIDPKAVAKLSRLFDRLYDDLQPVEGSDGEVSPVLVRLTPEAKAAFIVYHNSHADEQVNLAGDLSAAWSKLEEYAARIALVIHFVRWAAKDETLINENLVDLASMNAAISLTTWFKNEALRVYAMLDENDTQRDQRRLVDWLVNRGGSATAREVQRGCSWLKKPGEAESALENLAKADLGRWEDRQPPSGGRPTRVFVLST